MANSPFSGLENLDIAFLCYKTFTHIQCGDLYDEIFMIFHFAFYLLQ